MGKKAVRTTKAGRGSDQFMVRMPPGMRAALSAEAERNGRSINAEIVSRIDFTFQDIIGNEGVVALSKRMAASVDYLEQMLYDIRDIDLEAFILDQQSQGIMLTRSQAIRLILRTYLSEKGFARGPTA